MSYISTGLDISSNQHPRSGQYPDGAPIDFAAAKADGWSFIIIKATEGATYKNPYFTSDVAAARAAGFLVEAYHWVSPGSAATDQVQNVVTVLTAAGYTGRVWLDYEQQNDIHSKLDDVRAGLKAAGFTTGTYSYPNFWKYFGDHSCQACAADPLWFAWSFPEDPTKDAVTARKFILAPWDHVDIWQYKGTSVPVPGISGLQDANRLLTALPGLTATPSDPTSNPQPVPPAPKPVSPAPEIDMAQLPVLRQGATGQAVKNMQGLLEAHSFAIAIDGAFGPVTANALRAFQSNKHLTADGICGVQSWTALLKV